VERKFWVSNNGAVVSMTEPELRLMIIAGFSGPVMLSTDSAWSTPAAYGLVAPAAPTAPAAPVAPAAPTAPAAPAAPQAEQTNRTIAPGASGAPLNDADKAEMARLVALNHTMAPQGGLGFEDISKLSDLLRRSAVK
jgi:hypothetical protein